MLRIRNIQRVRHLNISQGRFISVTPSHPVHDIQSTSNHASVSDTVTLQQDTINSVGVDNIDAASTLIHQIGDLKALGFCNWTPPGFLQQFMEYGHVMLDMPWWAAIMGTTVLIRTAMMPLNIIAQRQLAKMKLAQPLTQDLQQRMNSAKNEGQQDRYLDLTHEMMHMYKTCKIQPLASIGVGFLNGPVFLSFFYALQSLSEFKPPISALTTGGMMWFTDLTVPDPYYALPVVSTASFLAVILREFNNQPTQTSSMQNTMKTTFFVGAIACFPYICTMPSALTLYWATNSIFTLLLTTGFKINKVKQFFNIPITVQDVPNLSDFYQHYGISPDGQKMTANSALTKPLSVDQVERKSDLGFMDVVKGSYAAVLREEQKSRAAAGNKS
ncbi:hypothetical protein MIR68_004325 [Amoeboaphelidium protococcarum]|nr:hypothetical protein MIR68_004325 [Amoeboaphelidium protococcarum]